MKYVVVALMTFAGLCMATARSEAQGSGDIKALANESSEHFMERALVESL